MKRSRSGKSTSAGLIKYIKKYKWLAVLSLVLSAVSVVATLYITVLVGDAVDCIIGAGEVNFADMMPILWKAVALIAIVFASQWIMNLCNNKITFYVVRDIRRDAFLKIHSMPLKYIDAEDNGDIVSRIVADAEQLSDGLLMGLTQLFSGIMTIITALIFMLTINVPITLVVVVTTPLSLFVAKYIAQKTYYMFKMQSHSRGMQTAFIDETLSNQKVVTAFSQQQPNMEHFDRLNKRLAKYSLKSLFFSSIPNPTTRFIYSLVYMGVGLFGALTAIAGHITVGGLTCFLSYANQYTKPFNEISGVITELQNAVACADRIFEFINLPSQSSDENSDELENIEGNVEFKNVCFSYSSDKKLIENFNLNVKSGMKVAIVGPTGCGKTTLINLLMRFYDTDSGGIYIDGKNIAAVSRSSLRRSFGMVLQDTWLKYGTIRENIAMANPNATDDEIVAAAKAAHSHSFIKRLPNGYDTVIGEDGGSLSQGQKQLLCITRIMLSPPPMLILDEATSSIDTRTEMRIQRAFFKLMKGKTSFIVAHRLSTIRDADLILVMKNGNIAEQGTHDELLRKNGLYAELFNSQFVTL